MRHIIIGGDGFVGQRLAASLVAMGETVVVADIVKSRRSHYDSVQFVNLDVTDPAAFHKLPITADDVVYNLSAKMQSPIMSRGKRRAFFWPVNYQGLKHILHWMDAAGAKRLVHFSTDKVYGHTLGVPTTEDEKCEPLGEYGRSKLASERLCQKYRDREFSISVFRPRLIIGPGRLGILSKLFKLIDMNLPVPLIGSGKNPYQFISVFDCASACIAAWRAGFPNKTYNLGSDNPPPVRQLLGNLILEANSWSVLVPTPASLVKFSLNSLDFVNMPIMDPEQYMIADEVCILSTEAAKADLGWAPQHDDSDMLSAAYREYRSALANKFAGIAPSAGRPARAIEKN